MHIDIYIYVCVYICIYILSIYIYPSSTISLPLKKIFRRLLSRAGSWLFLGGYLEIQNDVRISTCMSRCSSHHVKVADFRAHVSIPAFLSKLRPFSGPYTCHMQARFLQGGIPESSEGAEILGVPIFQTLERKNRKASSTIQVEVND